MFWISLKLNNYFPKKKLYQLFKKKILLMKKTSKSFAKSSAEFFLTKLFFKFYMEKTDI